MKKTKQLMDGGTKMKKIKLLTSVLFFTIILSSCTNLLIGRVNIDSDTKNKTLQDLFKAEINVAKLDTPENLTVSKGLYTKTVKLTWDKVPYATSYTIERAIVKSDSQGNFREPLEEEYEEIANNISSLYYTDDVTRGFDSIVKIDFTNRYYYRVCAENLEKDYESSNFSTPDYGFILEPPVNVIAERGKHSDRIRITWESSGLNYSYQIYKSDSSDSSKFNPLSKIIGCNYFDDTISSSNRGKEFYYYVTAISNEDNSVESIASSIAMGYTTTEGAPVAPENVTVVNGTGKSKNSITIKWDKVSTDDESKLFYNIYRNSDRNSQLIRIKKELESSVTTYTDIYADDNKILMNERYYYYIQSVYIDGETVKKSAFSETGPNEKNEASGYILSAPENCIAEDDSEDNSKIILKWTPPIGIEDNDYSYNIYTSNTSVSQDNNTFNSTFELSIIGCRPEIVNNIISLKTERYKYYKITSVNEDGIESDDGEVFAPSPLAPKNVFASKNAGAFNSANKKGVYNVKVTWEIQDGENPSGFNIYRSTSPDKDFKKINSESISGNTREYYDNSDQMQAGVYYYYRVVPLNFANYGINGNNPLSDTLNNCRGYGSLTSDQWFIEYNRTIMNSQKKLTLMHKKKDTDKLGDDGCEGDLSGNLTYSAKVAGLGAEIKMHYTNYADFYISGDKKEGYYFFINGDTNTSASMDSSGTMSGTVNCKGMYPGIAVYNNIKIINGAAGGGYYIVTTYDNSENMITESMVDWTIGNKR